MGISEAWARDFTEAAEKRGFSLLEEIQHFLRDENNDNHEAKARVLLGLMPYAFRQIPQPAPAAAEDEGGAKAANMTHITFSIT